jgi:hypothetical protein
MSVGIESVGDLRSADRSFGPARSSDGWRVVAAAWAVAILLVMLVAAVSGLSSRPASTLRAADDYAGVTIPRHDPNCVGLDAAAAAASSACPADVQAGIARAEASYYGW